MTKKALLQVILYRKQGNMTNEGRTVHIECQQKIRVHHKPSHKKIGPSISPSSCDPKYGGNKTLLLRTGIDSWTSPSPI